MSNRTDHEALHRLAALPLSYPEVGATADPRYLSSLRSIAVG